MARAVGVTVRRDASGQLIVNGRPFSGSASEALHHFFSTSSLPKRRKSEVISDATNATPGVSAETGASSYSWTRAAASANPPSAEFVATSRRPHPADCTASFAQKLPADFACAPGLYESFMNRHEVRAQEIAEGRSRSQVGGLTVYGGPALGSIRFNAQTVGAARARLRSLDQTYAWVPLVGEAPDRHTHPLASRVAFSVGNDERFYVNLTCLVADPFVLDTSCAPLRVWRESDGAYREWTTHEALVHLNGTELAHANPEWGRYARSADRVLSASLLACTPLSADATSLIVAYARR